MTFFPFRTSPAFHDIIPAFTHLRKSLDAPVDSVVVNSSRREQCTAAYLCFLLSIGPLQVAFPISTLQLRAFTPEKAFPLCRRRADEHATHRPGNFDGIAARGGGDRGGGDQPAAITIPQSIEYTQDIRTRASSYKQRRGQK